MMRNFKRLIAVLTVVAILATAPARADAATLIGRWGDRWSPEQLTNDYTSRKTEALVVVTFSTACPLAKRVVPTLNALQAEYEDERVQFIGLFPNASDDIRAMAEYAVDMNLTFPVFKDDADAPWHAELGLSTTPQVVVIDTRAQIADDAVVYRGQIDGRWAGGRGAGEHTEFLADALRAFVAGEKPPLSETAASGCDISAKPFRAADADADEFADVTYSDTIAPLIERRCASCHREGEAGAELFMAFDTYDAVAGAADVMLDRVEHRIMPPWHATTDPNNGTHGFQNDVRLSDREIARFRAWVQNGRPKGETSGDHNANKTPPRTAEEKSWGIGEVDMVYEMPEPYLVPVDQFDEYQYYRIPMNYPEDRYIQAIEMQPGNLAVVHHMGAIVGPADAGELSANAAMLRLYGLTGDKVLKIGDYVAGDPFNARVYPPGFALLLPAKHDLFFEMHYTPTGKEEAPDRSRMAIRWAEEKPEHVMLTKVFTRKDLRIPPHVGHYEKKSHYQFATDVLIYALAPHMHARGKDFTLYRVKNQGTDAEEKELILKVSAYDVNWQRTYEFVEPLKLKAGEALYSVAHFDNSRFNPNNLDPEATVRYGIQTTDEMLNFRVKFERTKL